MTKTNRARATVLSVTLATLALVVSACTSSSPGKPKTVTVTGSNGSSTVITSSSSSSTSSAPARPTVKVHIKTLNADGVQYGVGMPVIAFFNHTIKSAKDLQAATKVTVDGKPVAGGWYFETSTYYRGFPIEGHWRPENFWQPHSQVHVDIAAKGVSGGGDFVFDNSLTLDFAIGASHIGYVNDQGSTHTLTIKNDGAVWGTFPVSLGANDTPTKSGIKVIMEKGRDISMRGPGYYDAHVKWTQRLTYGGEYLHAAPWNTYNIDHGVDSSNGCTNLHPTDAQKLYGFLEVGDVVEYPNANGGRMQLGEGYGDWNVPWGVWQTGGLVPTR